MYGIAPQKRGKEERKKELGVDFLVSIPFCTEMRIILDYHNEQEESF